MSKHERIATPVTGEQKAMAALIDHISGSRTFVTPQGLGSITTAMTEFHSASFANRCCAEYATQCDGRRRWVESVAARATSRPRDRR
jgi:hypothetical protein